MRVRVSFTTLKALKGALTLYYMQFADKYEVYLFDPTNGQAFYAVLFRSFSKTERFTADDQTANNTDLTDFESNYKSLATECFEVRDG